MSVFVFTPGEAVRAAGELARCAARPSRRGFDTDADAAIRSFSGILVLAPLFALVAAGPLGASAPEVTAVVFAAAFAWCGRCAAVALAASSISGAAPRAVPILVASNWAATVLDGGEALLRLALFATGAPRGGFVLFAGIALYVRVAAIRSAGAGAWPLAAAVVLAGAFGEFLGVAALEGVCLLLP